MKKQTLIFLLTALSLLSACPAQTDSAAIQAPTEPPPAAVASYPQEKLSCCWEDLLKTQPEYASTATQAYNGDSDALRRMLKQVDQLSLSDSYAHGTVLATTLHHLGDQRFAFVLQDLQSDFKKVHPGFQESLQDTYRNLLEGGFVLSADSDVSQKSLADYPLTAGLLQYELN